MRGRHLDPYFVVAGAGLLGSAAHTAWIPCAVLGAVVVAAFALRSSRAPPRWRLLVLAGAAAAGVHLLGRRALAADHAAHAAALARLPRPSRCVVRAAIETMPRVRGVLGADLRVESLTCEDTPVDLSPSARIRLYGLPSGAARGDTIEAVADLGPARRPRNPDLGDASPQWARRRVVFSGSCLTSDVVTRASGPIAALDRLRARLRDGLETTLPPDVAPIARALVLGEEDLDPSDDEAFRSSGLTHLLAVSGAHVALVVGGLVAVLRVALLRWTSLARRLDVGRVAAFVGVPLAIVYEQLAGDSGSARRATAMAVPLLIAHAAGRRGDVARAVALSTLAILAADPLATADVSFALSLAATLGLLGLAQPIAERLPARLGRLRVVIAATVAATAACTPLILRLGGGIPLLGVAANLFAVPLGELAALPLANGVAALSALAAVVPAIGMVMASFADATSGAVRLLRAVARYASAPGWARLALPPPTPMQLAIVLAALAVAVILRAEGRTRLTIAAVAAAAWLLVEGVAVRAGGPHHRLRVTLLDVGQGDAVLVDLPDGHALLVDGGGEVGSAYDPGRAIVAPVLAARRRRELEAIVLTHPHPDHHLGLPAAMRDVSVGALWDTGQGESQGAGASFAALLAQVRARSIPVLRPRELCGAHPLGGATVEVLHPCPGVDPDSGANDNSFVLRLGFGARHALLVGDAEAATERRLLASSRDLRADFLKVGHHGSRTSSSASFLAAIAPRWAAISCGARNRFGHPHPETLEALAASSIRVLRTDVDGAIRWTTDGEAMDVATAEGEW